MLIQGNETVHHDANLSSAAWILVQIFALSVPANCLLSVYFSALSWPLPFLRLCFGFKLSWWPALTRLTINIEDILGSSSAWFGNLIPVNLVTQSITQFSWIEIMRSCCTMVRANSKCSHRISDRQLSPISTKCCSHSLFTLHTSSITTGKPPNY